MLHSMTGFGKAKLQTALRNADIEIRSLNSKFFDANMRLPTIYREKELEIRNILNQHLQRGKVDLSISLESGESSHGFSINHDAAKYYYQELKSILREMGEEEEGLMSGILRINDVVVPAEENLSDKEWDALEESIIEALAAVNAFREREGNALETDLKDHIQVILSLLEEVGPQEEERIGLIKKRLEDQIQNWLNSTQFDRNRLEQEAIYYLEKLDISEEKVRLRTHCQYFLSVLREGSIQKGRKLNFISQEMGREINTLGSKANFAPIQKIVVQMKDELEKIKEQLLNVL